MVKHRRIGDRVGRRRVSREPRLGVLQLATHFRDLELNAGHAHRFAFAREHDDQAATGGYERFQ